MTSEISSCSMNSVKAFGMATLPAEVLYEIYRMAAVDDRFRMEKAFANTRMSDGKPFRFPRCRLVSPNLQLSTRWACVHSPGSVEATIEVAPDIKLCLGRLWVELEDDRVRFENVSYLYSYNGDSCGQTIYSYVETDDGARTLIIEHPANRPIAIRMGLP